MLLMDNIGAFYATKWILARGYYMANQAPLLL